MLHARTHDAVRCVEDAGQIMNELMMNLLLQPKTDGDMPSQNNKGTKKEPPNKKRRFMLALDDNC